MLDTLKEARMATVPVPLKFTHAFTLLSARTKAVVAICVVLVRAVAVVERGVPVKVGLANGARVVSLAWT